MKQGICIDHHALEFRLSNERIRLANEETKSGRALRKVWVAQLEREVAQERAHVGVDDQPLSDDDLLAALLD